MPPTESDRSQALQRALRRLVDVAAAERWDASVGIGLIDRRRRDAVGIVISATPAAADRVRHWLAEHPQPVEVTVRIVDDVRAR